jgi:hypothetical protein
MTPWPSQRWAELALLRRMVRVERRPARYVVVNNPAVVAWFAPYAGAWLN